MERKTADLGSYIISCHSSHRPTDQIFDQGLTHLRPQLESGRMNRILLYPGCFNPPHRGHQAALNHAFTYSQDANVIAAIVLPLDDKVVEAKFRRQKQKKSLVFTKRERVQLWRGHGTHDWCWIYDRDTQDWQILRRRLTDAINKDGFDLKFVVVAGPDHIKRDLAPPCNPWDCEEIIVSNVGRAADFVTYRQALARLNDCGPWKSIIPDDEEILRYARSSASFLSSGLSLIAPKSLIVLLEREPNIFEKVIDDIRFDEKKKLKAVSVCSRKGAPEKTIRFIAGEDQMNGVSSTQIRRLIETVELEELQARLESLALNPAILVELIQVRRKAGLVV